ncbi:MAG: ABC transporter ATP-binding protein [Mailhella sp.]|nr:ABC transporter ATP-binding protein [Mailhella sp.]
MIELSHVTKVYPLPRGQRKVVLDDITHTFHEGTSMGILGLNGAGKSTLMRLICGAEAPDKGRVKRTSRVSWPIGFSGGFHGSLTGRENMRFTCRIYGADIKKVTEFVEDFSELGPYMDMPIRTYSSGMKSKLAFGLSMAIGFDFYLIDEGYAVGDASFRAKSELVFQERKAHATCLVVAHSTSVIRQNCDNAVILKDGKFMRFDTLDDALKTYEGMIHAGK